MLHSRPQFWAYAALLSVCFFWGTTYISIRMALEAFPPLTIVAVRYLMSGSLLLAACWLKGARLPRGRELALTALNGVLVLSIGNGALVMAETWIASGLAALIITISPFWTIGLNALIPPREPMHGPTLLGMSIGLGGAVLLVGPGALAGGQAGHSLVKGFLMLQFGCFGWVLGSLLQRKQPSSVHPIVSGAVQQLAAGIAMVPLALAFHTTVHWNARSSAAVLYLVFFGSIVGYSSYIYAFDRLPVAVASIYNYVNPVVAVLLGWLFYREPFGMRELAAMLIIFAGVAVVKRMDARRAPSAPRLDARAESAAE